MGKRGPSKTPAAVLKLHGTYRKDRHSGVELPPDAPSCPEWLDDEAKAEWDRVIGVLVERIGLASVDRAVLSAYCQSWSAYHSAVKWIAENGETYEDEYGPKKHPMVLIRNEERAAMFRFAQQLGLSPSSRTGLKVEPKTKAGVQSRNRKA